MMGAGPLVRRYALAAALVAACGPTSVAEQRESLSRFWTDVPATQRPVARPERTPLPQIRRSAPPRRQIADTQPKAPPADAGFVVAVFGDETADDVMRGLAAQFKTTPDIAVLDRTGDDETIASSSAAAWADRIAAAKAGAKRLDAAVVMVGGAEPETADGGSQPADLGAKVEAIAAAFRDKQVPLYWVGLPPVHDAVQSQRYLARNAVIREHAEKSGATYIDTWEAFTDDNGQFDSYGPDVDGQRTKLRRSDGTRFTLAGARKLASFAEADIERLRSRQEAAAKLASIPIDDPAVFDQALQVDINAQIRREAGLEAAPPPVEKPGPVISLVTPPTSPGGRLSTDESPLAFAESVPTRHEGRIDDFTWPRP